MHTYSKNAQGLSV